MIQVSTNLALIALSRLAQDHLSIIKAVSNAQDKHFVA